MKKIFLSILILIQLHLSAQTIKTKIYTTLNDVNDGPNVPLSVITNKNTDTVCFLMRTKNSITGYSINSEYQSLYNFKINIRKSHLFTGLIKKNKTLFLLGFANDLHVHSYDPLIQKESDTILPINKKVETIISVTKGKNEIFVLTIIKNSSTLKLYTVYDQSSIITSECIIDATIFAKYFNNSLFEIITDDNEYRKRPSNVVAVNFEIENPPSALIAPNKLYVSGDTLFLTINKKLEGAVVLPIYTHAKTIFPRLIEHDFAKCIVNSSSLVSYNSFVQDNNFYSISACEEAFNVSVNNIHNGSLIKKIYSLDNTINPFKNIVFNVRDIDSNVNKIDLSNLIQKMVNENAIISTTLTNQNKIKLIIGSGKEMNKATFWPYISFIDPFISVISLTTFSASGGFNKHVIKEYQFSILLDRANYQILTDKTDISYILKANIFMKEKDIPAVSQSLFKILDKNYFAYYDYSMQSINIAEF